MNYFIFNKKTFRWMIGGGTRGIIKGIVPITLLFLSSNSHGVEFRLKLIPDPAHPVSELSWDPSVDTQNPPLQLREVKQNEHPYFVKLRGAYKGKYKVIYEQKLLPLDQNNQFEIEVEVRKEKTEFQLIEISDHGTTFTEKAQLEFPQWDEFEKSHQSQEKGKPIIFDFLTEISSPMGFLTETRSSGATCTTDFLGNAYELAAQLKYRRQESPEDRAVEVSLKAAGRYTFPISGITIPMTGRATLDATYLNAIRSGRWKFQPLVAIQVESLDTLSTLYTPSSSGQIYQNRTLYSLWAGLGMGLRWQGEKRWWEIIPTAYYTVYARSTLDATGGWYSQNGWKFNLRILTPFLKKLYGGVEGSFYTVGDNAQILGLVGGITVGYHF